MFEIVSLLMTVVRREINGLIKDLNSSMKEDNLSERGSESMEAGKLVLVVLLLLFKFIACAYDLEGKYILLEVVLTLFGLSLVYELEKFLRP